MVFPKRILVTTDLSEHSLAAFEYASTVSLLFNAKIYVLHVYDREARGQPQSTEEEARKALREFILQSISSELDMTLVVRCGTPAEEIVRFAEEEGIDLIVIATHGRTGLKHIMMGSVAEKIVRRSNIPVLSVKPGPMQDMILKDEDIENELHLRP
jgi:universal stress protein A